jgi:hypothetical protein
MMQATDWQQHSVRGFLAGTVKRKLGFSLTSLKPNGGVRRYRIETRRGRRHGKTGDRCRKREPRGIAPNYARDYARGGGDYAEPQYGWPVLSWFNSGLNGQGRPALGGPPRGGFN